MGEDEDRIKSVSAGRPGRLLLFRKEPARLAEEIQLYDAAVRFLESGDLRYMQILTARMLDDDLDMRRDAYHYIHWQMRERLLACADGGRCRRYAETIIRVCDIIDVFETMSVNKKLAVDFLLHTAMNASRISNARIDN
jgi:hypothetical protein